MKEYIVPIYDDSSDYDEIFVGNIRDDAVEVVRCKDCKYAAPNGKYGCTAYHYKRYETHDMKPDDFCSFAERRT